MLDKTNITFLSEQFFGHVYYLIGSNENDCSMITAAVMAILMGSIVAVSKTIAVTDNNANAGDKRRSK